MSIGVVSRLTDAAVAVGQLLKIGTDEDHVAICGAADTPRYIALQAAAAAGVAINCQEVGTNRSVPVQVLANGVIAAGSLVEPAAGGQVQLQAGTVGTHHIVGWLPNAATGAGQLVDLVGTYFLRVI